MAFGWVAVLAMNLGCADPAAGGGVPAGDGRVELAEALGPDLGSLPFRLSGPLDRPTCLALRPDGSVWPQLAETDTSGPCVRLDLSDPRLADSFRRASQRSRDRAQNAPSGTTIHAWALSKLLVGKELESALLQAREAADLAPKDAEVRNDLGVARALLALRSGSARDLASAYGDFDRALALARAGSDLAELAAANAQRVLAYLGAPDPAAIEPAGSALASPQRFLEGADGLPAPPPELRERFQELLASWIDALGASDEDAAANRRHTAAACAAALRRAGDPWAADVIAALDRSLGAGSAGTVRAIGSWQRWQEGEGLVGDKRYDEAVHVLAASLGPLERDFGPLAHRLRRDLFLAHYLANRYDAAIGALAPLLDPAAARYPYAHADALRLAGLVAAIRGDHGDALAWYEAAVEPAARSGDPAMAAALHRTLADSLMLLEDAEGAWQQLGLGLVQLEKVRSPAAHYAFYQAAEAVAQGSGDLALARVFADAAVPLAEDLGDPVLLAGALRLRAETLSALSQQEQAFGNLPAALSLRDEALEDLAAARRLLPSLPDEQERRSVAGDLDLAEARVLASTEPARALEVLDRAAVTFASTEYAIKLPQALLLRARSYRALGRFESAETSALDALAEVEAQLSSLGDLDWLPLSRRSQEIYFELVRARLDAGCGADRGLEAADAALGLDLGARLARSAGLAQGGATAGQLVAALPANTHALVYWVDDEEICIWSLRNEDQEPLLRRVEVTRRELEEEVEALRGAIDEGTVGDRFARPSEALHRLLIAPVADRLAPGETLLIAAAAPLDELPFGALRDRETEKVLVEDHPLVFTPSLGFARQLRQREALATWRGSEPDAWSDTGAGSGFGSGTSAGSSTASLRVAAIAATDPDPLRHGSQRTLRHAAEEAANVLALLGDEASAALLVGPEATLNNLLEATHDADVFYYTGHAEAPTGTDPHLLLAGPADLYPDDLLALAPTGPAAPRLFHPRLVILSACATATTSTQKDLPTAFLTAGAQSVVANLWPVYDQSAAELMESFLRYLTQGFPEPEALRRAQLDARAAGEEPRVWAAGRVVGAGG